MKITEKTGKKTTVFKKHTVQAGDTMCPVCHREFKEYDLRRLNNKETIACAKCGEKLTTESVQ